MADGNTQDTALDVPSSELMSQDELGESSNDGNALLTALGGGAADDEFMDDESSHKTGGKLTPRIAIIAGIVIGGGGMIYGMRQYEIKQGMDMAPLVSIPKYDVALNSKPLTDNEERVLASLRVSANPVQPAPDLGRNPLELDGHEDKTVVDTPDIPVGPDIEALTREYTRIFETLHLSSVIPSGRVPVAVVNRKPVVVGDMVAECFMVREIARNTSTNNMYVRVELVGYDPAVDGVELILHINSGR